MPVVPEAVQEAAPPLVASVYVNVSPLAAKLVSRPVTVTAWAWFSNAGTKLRTRASAMANDKILL